MTDYLVVRDHIIEPNIPDHKKMLRKLKEELKNEHGAHKQTVKLIEKDIKKVELSLKQLERKKI